MSNIHHYNYQSFSSSLLEEIYNSFDDNEFDSRSRSHIDSGYARRAKMAKTNNNKNNNSSYNTRTRVETNTYDEYVFDQWMEKEKAKIRRNSMPDDGRFRRPFSLISSSSTSSSGSSSSTVSDTESLYGTAKPSRKVPILKPIRTASSSTESRRERYSDEISATVRKKVGKNEGKLQLQQRALKLYGDLKKVKQPISPGGKLASFLNSLFHTNNNNHGKKHGVEVKPSLNSDHVVKIPTVSTPSTASSYSRSCLSKTPSSAGRFERRSVRFCPVTEVYNDDVRRMYVSTTETTTLASDEEFKVKIKEKHRRVDEAAKELLKNYHTNNSNYMKELKVNIGSEPHNGRYFNKNSMEGLEFEDEDDDDNESCCSSDLFELDNLLDVGVDDRYRQELPVYETTQVGTNRAIANGFIL